MPSTDYKLKIAVLMGGPSAEHEISLKTGAMVLENLDRKKYSVRAVKISKSGKWPITPAKIKKDFDLAYIAMHGEYGEDGTIQKILDQYKIRYTGSKAKASFLGMDKAKSSTLFKKAGLNVPEFNLIHVGKEFRNFRVDMDFPVVVKPNDRGSSVGVSIVENLARLLPAIELASKYSPNVMIQKFIKGREFTCGVLEFNGKPKAFLPTEIIPRSSKFFDYEAKYVSGASQEITPPKLFKDEIKKIQQIVIKAHKAIGVKGYSRTDMIMDAREKFYVLEINTLPGMTETSLLPQAAKAEGITFSKLLDLIIESAL